MDLESREQKQLSRHNPILHLENWRMVLLSHRVLFAKIISEGERMAVDGWTDWLTGGSMSKFASQEKLTFPSLFLFFAIHYWILLNSDYQNQLQNFNFSTISNQLPTSTSNIRILNPSLILNSSIPQIPPSSTP